MVSFNASLAGRHQIQFVVTQESIPMTSEHPTVDESWTFTDAAGHAHHYEHGYPTLDKIIDAVHWCNGDEGIYNHDPHDVVDEMHYECKVCREVIVPRLHPPFHTIYRPGMRSATASGYRTDGTKIECILIEEEVETLTALLRSQDSDGVQRWLDEFPEERIVSSRYDGRFPYDGR